jgi:hypothetical protein
MCSVSAKNENQKISCKCTFKHSVSEQFTTLSHMASFVASHGVGIDNLQAQAGLFHQKVVSAEAKSNSAYANTREAKVTGKKSEITADCP